MSTWNDWHTNGRTFKDLIHPSGVDEQEYNQSGEASAKHILERCKFNKKHKVLEYGCGNGRILRHLQDYNVYGCDLVDLFVKDGTQLGVKKLYKLDKLKRNNFFDIVFSYTVFIHLNDEDTEKALKYIYQKLKSGGLAYLQIPIYDEQTDHDGHFISVRSWKKEKLFSLVEKIGFKIIDYKKNPGLFSFDKIGENHEYLHCFEKS